MSGDAAAGRDFGAEVVALEAMLGEQRDVAVARLRAVHEAWARALIGIAASGKLVAQVRAVVERGSELDGAVAAVEHLRAAEERQWEIGTWSSGSGEGLSSMYEVRTLQLARAWLLAGMAQTDDARALLEEVQGDPNDSAAPHRKHMRALSTRLTA